MASQRGLDEFLGEPEPATPSSIETTFLFRPDARCPVCEEGVNRLWLEDGEHVCASCKEW